MFDRLARAKHAKSYLGSLCPMLGQTLVAHLQK